MALPAGVTTFTLQFGAYSDAQGLAALVASGGKLFAVDPSTNKRIKLTHIGTGQVIVPEDVPVTIGSDGTGSVGPIPHTGQASLSPAGYAWRVEWNIASRKPSPGNLTFVVPSGATADFDLLVPAETVPAVAISQPTVASVNGQTGAVVIDAVTPTELTDGLAGKQDAATLAADTAAHVSDGSALDTALKAKLGSPTDVGFDLILLLGQSNMEGGASGTAYDARLDPAGDRVYSFDFSGVYSRQIVQAADPLIHAGGNLGLGPGLSFGRWYAATVPVNRRVLLVPCAVGGTPLVSTTPSTWNPDVRDSLYDQAIIHIRRALATAGANSRIVAALWSQGETDADSSVTQAAYAAKLDALIDRLRTDVGNAALPFVVGSMVPEYVASVPSRTPVAAAHAATPTRRAYTSFLQGPGGFVTVDGVHYNADGQRIQGRNMVTALEAAKVNTAAPPTVLPAITDTTPAVSVTVRGTPTYGAGKFGNALLGGVIGTSAPWAATAAVGTLEAWVRDGGANWRQAVGVHTGAWIGHDGPGLAGGPGGGEIISALGQTNGDGQWHHLALTMDGSHARLWVDGKLARIGVSTANFLTGAGPLAIGGAYFDPSGDWAGGIDEVRISSVLRYTAPFTPPTAPFVLDRDTLALYHLNG